MKKNISWLVLWALMNQLFLPLQAEGTGGNQNFSVVYLGKSNQRQAKAFKVLEKRIQTWMENGPFEKVQVKSVRGTVEENELVLEQLRVQLMEYTRTLKKAVLESSDKSKGEKSLAEIKILRRKMHLIGRFGPYLQKSYLAEAAFLWKNERFTESEASLKKAMELDPFGKPNLEEWDMFSSSFSLFAFEKEVARVYQKMNQFCETSITVKQNSANLKVNGFDLREKRVVKLLVNAMHVIAIRDTKGHTVESVLHCPKKSQKKITLDISKNTTLSTEMSLYEALASSNAMGVFVGTFKKDVLELYFYSPKTGVTPITLEKKIVESELLEASQDFKIPVSYSTMNRILSSHFGANALLVSGNNKGILRSGTLEEKFRNSDNKWYNSPILWGIIGGIAVGAATTYVLTKDGNSEPPKTSVSLEVK